MKLELLKKHLNVAPAFIHTAMGLNTLDVLEFSQDGEKDEGVLSVTFAVSRAASVLQISVDLKTGHFSIDHSAPLEGPEYFTQWVEAYARANTFVKKYELKGILWNKPTGVRPRG